MRPCFQTTCLSILVVSFGLSQIAAAQQFNGPSFRLYKDGTGRVVAAHYEGEAGIDSLIRHGNAQSSDFAPATRLHSYPHLKSLTFPYGSTLTAEDVGHIATAKNLKEIELGYVGVNSEYVSIEGDLSKLGQLKRLERVHLCKQNMTDKDLKFIASLPRIKHLDFNADTSGWKKNVSDARIDARTI